MNPKVTIVIPVYNGSNYMREAIDSALAQSYENIEVIVVNDGSTDDTEEIALSYGNRIRYFSKENGGVSTALNVGIANMTGEYFQFLPHDDIMHPNKIKIQIEAIQKTGNEMTITWSGWNELWEPEHRVKPFEIPPGYPRSCWERGIYPLFFGILNVASVLLNRKYFDIAGNFDPDLKTAQDYDICFRTFGTQRTLYIDQPLMSYRFHEAQGTQTEKEFVKNCQDLIWKVLKNITEDEINAIFSSRYQFYFAIGKYYRDFGWEELLAYTAQQISQLEEPENSAAKRAELAQKICAEGRPLVLYGAGKNGRKLRRELWLYGIEISAWCDSNPEKVGTIIDGVRCIGAGELDPASPVIVTMDHPEPVKEMLAAQGFARVMDYWGAAEVMWEAYPIKERTLRFLQWDC